MPTLIASAKSKIVYLNMPKAGCTSFKNWLHWIDYGTYLDDPMSIHRVQEGLFLVYDRSPEKFQERLADFTFTFVRHPLRRAYATFNDKIAHVTGPYYRRASKLFSQRYGIHVYDSTNPLDLVGRMQSRSVKWHRNAFLKFLSFVEDTKAGLVDFDYDWHWAEQMHVLDNARPVRNPDFIGKLEHTDVDFPIVAAHAGVPADSLRRLNESTKLGPSYDEVVDDAIRELGAKVYARDFREFGYDV